MGDVFGDKVVHFSLKMANKHPIETTTFHVKREGREEGEYACCGAHTVHVKVGDAEAMCNRVDT